MKDRETTLRILYIQCPPEITDATREDLGKVTEASISPADPLEIQVIGNATSLLECQKKLRDGIIVGASTELSSQYSIAHTETREKPVKSDDLKRLFPSQKILLQSTRDN